LQIPTESIKALREKTGAGVLDCKNALIKTSGDFDGAMAILKERGLVIAEKKAQRPTREGLIEAYVHTGGRIGALVEVNCETDFVARTDEFKSLAHDLAMQVTATGPKFLSPDDASGEEDPAEVCLLLQPFIKEPQKTIQDVINEVKAKLGENIRVGRFTRFQLGD